MIKCDVFVQELRNISAALDSMSSMREKLDRLMAETNARQVRMSCVICLIYMPLSFNSVDECIMFLWLFPSAVFVRPSVLPEDLVTMISHEWHE